MENPSGAQTVGIVTRRVAVTGRAEATGLVADGVKNMATVIAIVVRVIISTRVAVVAIMMNTTMRMIFPGLHLLHNCIIKKFSSTNFCQD